MNCWFVEPALDRLPLSGGEWIEVKRELSIGEWFDMRGALGESFARMDLGRAQMLAYIVNWSLRDPQGQPTKCTADTLGLLKFDRYREIDGVLGAHIVRQDELRSAEKNGQDGESTSSVLSSSVANSI